MHKRLLQTITVLTLVIMLSPTSRFSQDVDEAVPRNHFMAKFRDVDITDFLKTMAKITRKNILIDDSVKGKITIVSYKFIPVSRAMDFLKQVLESKGYAVIENNNFINIVKGQDAGEISIPQKKDPIKNSAGIVSRVVRLPSGAKVQTIIGLLRPLVGNETKLSGYDPTNTLVLTGYAQSIRRSLKILKELGLEEEVADLTPEIDDSSGNIHIYHVKNMEAESLANVLIRLDNPQLNQPEAAPKGKTRGNVPPPVNRPGVASKIKAVSHKESNSLIVTAESEEWREIRQIISRLDIKRKQMLLEVLIVEVNSEKLNDYGIDWRYGNQGPHAQFNTGKAIEGGMIDPATGNFTGANTLAGFSMGFLDKGGDLLGIFNANVSNQNFNVLSAPQILTVDNQEAEINVGQDVPVRTQERTVSTGSADTLNSYDYRPAGIKLKFTPHINPDGMISLDLLQEVTNIAGGQTAGSNPTFNKRTMKTFVTVIDKQTIVIGGLVNSERQHGIQKIPLLGDIPLLGFLFRRTTYFTKKTNLMVFITPHLLNRKDDADRITNYKREEQIRASRDRTNEIKLWPEEKVPSGIEDEFKKIDSP